MSFLVVCLNPTIQRTIVLSRLARGQVNRAGETYVDASGKGLNVARVLTQMGARAVQLTQAGGRERARFLALAAGDGVDVRWVESESEIRTATTLVEPGGVATEIVEESAPVAPGTEARVRAAFTECLASAHTVVVSGSKAAGFSEALYPDLVREARAAGRRVILDVRGEDLRRSLPLGPDVVKPNLAELVATFLPELTVAEEDEPPAVLEAVARTMRALHATYGTLPVVTRGPRPTLFVAEGAVDALAPPHLAPVNPIGSGDAFAAGLALGLHEGRPLRDAIRLGHSAAAQNAALLRPGRIH